MQSYIDSELVIFFSASLSLSILKGLFDPFLADDLVWSHSYRSWPCVCVLDPLFSWSF